MKKFLVFLFAIGIGTAFADTINLHWLNYDGTIYQNSTCTVDNDLIVPSTPPTKYGYTFTGWKFTNYTPIEYLENTGTQYINTGIKASVGINIEVTAKLKSYDAIIFGSRLIVKNTSTNAIFFDVKQERTIWLYGDSIQHNVLPVIPLNSWHTIKTMEGSYYLDGNFVAAYSKGTISNGQDMLLFASNNVGSSEDSITIAANLQISNFKISDLNNTLIRDMIPVLDTDGVPCMLDKVEGKFYYNAGTGNFIAGPALQ